MDVGEGMKGYCTDVTIPRGFSQENPEFSKQKSICEANFAWIFARYWNGVNSNYERYIE